MEKRTTFDLVDANGQFLETIELSEAEVKAIEDIGDGDFHRGLLALGPLMRKLAKALPAEQMSLLVERAATEVDIDDARWSTIH